MRLTIYVDYDIILSKAFQIRPSEHSEALTCLQCFNSKFGGNSMFEVRNLRSVKIGFPYNQEISERLFSSSKPTFISNWGEERIKKFSSLISELDGSKKEEDIFLRQQCYVAIEIIHFADNHAGEIHMVHHSEKNTLEFFFEFYDARHAFLFESNLRDHVKTTTGFQL